jgi:hypothetical protein
MDATIGQLIALYRPGGCQGDNQQTTMQNPPPLLAISMAMAVRWYSYTAHIA